jgi:hypothetical protein
VIRCPNCGEANDLGSRFCFNCGASLAGLQPEPTPAPPADAAHPADAAWQPAPPEETQPAAAEEVPPPPSTEERPRPSIPPQYAPPSSWSGGQPAWGAPGQAGQAGQPTRSGWAAIDELDPPPPPKRRATWLMVILGIIGGCLLVCVGTFVFMLTPPGEDTFEEISTVFAELATEQAPEPTRVP